MARRMVGALAAIPAVAAVQLVVREVWLRLTAIWMTDAAIGPRISISSSTAGFTPVVVVAAEG